jgi:predicted dehydrogenase
MKIAVIGCGKQGRRHLSALAGLSGVTGLVAADADPTRCGVAATLFGAACLPVDAVFAGPGVDAVVIATPTMTHLPLARRAVEAGKHFLCEKPFGADAATARQIAQDAAACGIVGRVGYLYRFAPAIAAAREAVAGLGKIDTARFVIAAPGSHAAWKHQRERRGGAINELASHMLDLALWCFGPMRACEISEKSQSRAHRVVDGVSVAVDAEDRIAMRLRSASGVAIDIEADFAAPQFSQWLEIRGEQGSVRASIEGAPDLYRLQAQSFLDAIAGNRGAACDLFEAARARELLDRLHAAPAEAA